MKNGLRKIYGSVLIVISCMMLISILFGPRNIFIKLMTLITLYKQDDYGADFMTSLFGFIISGVLTLAAYLLIKNSLPLFKPKKNKTI